MKRFLKKCCALMFVTLAFSAAALAAVSVFPQFSKSPAQSEIAASVLENPIENSVNAENPNIKNQDASRPVLILMYHQFLNSRKSKYIVKPDQFREDLRALKRHGYESVRAAELAAFVSDGAPLPEKPVLITFDDGHYSNLHYAAKILKEEGFTAVESVIGRFSQTSTDTGTGGNPNYSHLTWEDIAEMNASGIFEIGNHSFDMHNYKPRFGIGQKAGESDDAYQKALTDDAVKLQTILKEKSGVTPTVFAFPFGKYNDLAKKTLYDLGFTVMLTCNERVSTIVRGKPESLWELGRFNRNPDYDIDAFLTVRDAAFRKDA